MKKYMAICMAVAVALVAALYAAQESALTIRQVRDPVQLRAALNANAADAEARIAIVEAGSVAVNAAAAFTAATNAITALQGAASAGFRVVGTQLVYVAGSVTNVIDADITSAE